jgi:Ca2+-binding RTX toxin-like protein
MVAASGAGCVSDGDDEQNAEDPALGDLTGNLTSLSSVCAVTGTAPSLTVTLSLANGGNLVLVQKSTAGNLLINNLTSCGGTTVLMTDVIAFNIVGGTGDDNVIIDYAAGLFMSGTAGQNAVIDFNGTSGTADTLRIRGTKAADIFTFGMTTSNGTVINVKTAADANVDINASNIDAIIVSTGAGNDAIKAGGDGVVASDTGFPILVPITMYGGDGNDTFVGGAANDTFYGGAGTDTVDYSARTTITDVNLDNVALDGCAEATCNTAVNGTSSATGAGTVTATATNATLNQYAGYILQSAAVAPNNRYRVVSNTASATVPVFTVTPIGAALATPTGGAFLVGGEFDNVQTDVENVTGSLTAGNTLTGSAGANVLVGGGVVDTISGGAGNDTISGGVGDDVLSGDAGNDTVNGGAGNDTVNGGAGDDTLNGDDGDDTLKGGAGNDVENGGAGDDLFDEETTSNGADIFNGGAGTADTVTYAGRGAAITVTIGLSTAGNGDGEALEVDDVKADVENVTGSATAGNTLTGSAAANLLIGGSGVDVIYGGLGDDYIVGGTGADTLGGGCATACLVDGDDTIEANDGVADTLVDGGSDNDLCMTDSSDLANNIANCE